MKSFKQYLAEVSLGDPVMDSQMAELDRRAQERENNQLLQTQLDQSIDQMNQRDYGMYNIPGMPNLSANIEFSSQSRARSGSGIPTPTSELDSFYNLGSERQQTVAPGLPTDTLKRMQQAQYDRSQGIQTGAPGSRMAPRMSASSAQAQNTISRTLEDRKGPLGGQAGARTYAERLNRNSQTLADTSSANQRALGMANPVVGAANRVRQQAAQADTDTALAGKNYAELSAMRDALDKEIKADFAAGKKTIDPAKYRTYTTLNRQIDSTLDNRLLRSRDKL